MALTIGLWFPKSIQSRWLVPKSSSQWICQDCIRPTPIHRQIHSTFHLNYYWSFNCFSFNCIILLKCILTELKRWDRMKIWVLLKVLVEPYFGMVEWLYFGNNLDNPCRLGQTHSDRMIPNFSGRSWFLRMFDSWSQVQRWLMCL